MVEFMIIWVGHKAHYSRLGPKVNLMMAVERANTTLLPRVLGSIDHPMRWVYIPQDSINHFIFGNFLNEILTDIEVNPVSGGYANHKCILWDNLQIHKTPYDVALIWDGPSLNNFILVYQPQYRPKLLLLSKSSMNLVQNWLKNLSENRILMN